MKYLSDNLMKYPTPVSINVMWNMGSLLGASLMMQVLSGIFLSFFYCSDVSMAFSSLIHINNNVMSGWLIRFIHSNGVTLFFFLIYIHVGRGLYYKSYKITKVWIIGVTILLVYMMSAFLGYVLPWGQMSYWGATVITNLISVIPYLGHSMVEWVWGSFSVSKPTLSRFFAMHFFMPFIGVMFVTVHLIYLHSTGSSNPLGIMSDVDKFSFHPIFSIKDLVGILIYVFFLLIMMIKFPFMFMDPDNFVEANPMNTPAHIQPEWYFLFAYSILRSIPSKMGGVVMMMSSIMILLILPTSKKSKTPTLVHKGVVSLLILSMGVLTFIGSMPVEMPFLMMSQGFTLLYFVCYFSMLLLYKFKITYLYLDKMVFFMN